MSFSHYVFMEVVCISIHNHAETKTVLYWAILTSCLVSKIPICTLKQVPDWVLWPERTGVDPLTPVPPITSHDEPWPFFHFWRHHFWPKLASSMLNFRRRRRSFQWCPDQSDRLNGALDMHKNAQSVERKTQTKICCHHTWLLHGKSCLSWWRFPRSFLTASKPSRRSITAAKTREKEKKERQKKNSKNRKA